MIYRGREYAAALPALARQTCADVIVIVVCKQAVVERPGLRERLDAKQDGGAVEPDGARCRLLQALRLVDHDDTIAISTDLVMRVHATHDRSTVIAISQDRRHGACLVIEQNFIDQFQQGAGHNLGIIVEQPNEVVVVCNGGGNSNIVAAGKAAVDRETLQRNECRQVSL